MISAKVIADSKNEFGNRITTMVVTFPRIILAEFNTHRMFSRNSASSRAIPFEKMLKSVEENPFIPIAWQKDHKGMQGTEYFTEKERVVYLESKWLEIRDKAVEYASGFSGGDVTKQLCNRLLEPFMWHTVIVTATEWENFFALRCPKYKFLISEDGYRSRKDLLKANPQLGFSNPDDKPYVDWLRMNEGQAEIHMMAIAEAMWDAYNEHTPKELKAGEWHIPFGDGIELFDNNKGLYWSIKSREQVGDYSLPDRLKILEQEYKIKIATARCARVSYTVVGEEGKEPNYENDIKLHDRLAASGHWSPFEHCAQAMGIRDITGNLREPINALSTEEEVKSRMGWSGNFRGFIQYRKMFENENIR